MSKLPPFLATLLLALTACAPYGLPLSAQSAAPAQSVPAVEAVQPTAPAPQPTAPAPQPPAPNLPDHLKDIPAAPPVPAVTAISAIVIDAVSGRVLAAKNPDQQRAIASIQKLLTAITVIDSGNIDQKLTVTRSDQKVEPARVYISAGESYTRRYLLNALIVKSGNDVAKALARDHSGSYEKFASAMNAKAKEIGMANSHFINASGLTESGQYSTARDVAVLARRAYRYPLIREAARTKSTVFTYPNGKTRKLENTNELLGSIPYCTGLKTGTTMAAGRCLVSTGELNGRTTIVVVLGTKTPTNLWQDSEKLLRWSLEHNHY